jgi:hypothetical protein
VLATRISKRSGLSERIRPASVSLLFVNGSSDNIKIVANPEGIRALKDELDQAEKSIRGNKSYFFGDPLWMRSNSKLVAIEPTQSRSASFDEAEPAIENTEIGPRIFLFSLIMIAFTLMTIGTVTIFKWLF